MDGRHYAHLRVSFEGDQGARAEIMCSGDGAFFVATRTPAAPIFLCTCIYCVSGVQGGLHCWEGATKWPAPPRTFLFWTFIPFFPQVVCLLCFVFLLSFMGHRRDSIFVRGQHKYIICALSAHWWLVAIHIRPLEHRHVASWNRSSKI